MAEAPWRTQGPTGPPGVGRHKSDVSDRKEPPLCVQNAMLTKDKKPFTYTPGGIDLSEIKSPRMARRIERNANAPGVGDVIQQLPPQGYTGPLPPSALAAMQPALPVQVFPSGPPPPPPPPPVHIPPPPPMGPLPTKSVATTEGVFERPDMTKIIPENPMALLRKTSGANRRSFIDDTDYSRPQNVEPQYSQAQVRPQAQFTQPKPQPQMVSQPQYNFNSVPVQEPQPEVKTSTAQLGSLYIPPLNNAQEVQRAASSPPSPPQRKVQTPDLSPESPPTPAANLNKSPRPWQNQKPAQQDLPPWAQKSQSPPLAQQQSPPVQVQQQQILLPSPPVQQQQRQLPSPPVQQQQRQLPTSPLPQQPRLIQQIKPPHQQQPPAQPTIVGRVIIPVQMDLAPGQNNQNVDAVYVTQPVVLQHPGVRPEANIPSQQQRVIQTPPKTQAQDSLKGTRIIPIQIEGASTPNVQRQESKLSTPGTTPATPGSARNFSRQPSWSSTPTQSNSFKVIQKMTNTDGDEDDEDEVTTEHSPKSSQNFQQQQQQQVPIEQARKLKLTEGDRELMNKFKQGVDEENSIHKEVDPRYRGAAIPSKAFRFLQSMTDGSDAVSAPVPRSPQGGGGGVGNGSPQIRTIPVQIEGVTSGKPYVPASEQTVQEPKKYTGSAIPSRSFKMLQAMTGDACADVGQANETNENYRFDPSHYWGYNPNFLPMPPPPPYWQQFYYSPCPTPNSDSSKDATVSRNTPVPFISPPKKKCKNDSESPESDSINRNTPLPFWSYYPPPPQYAKSETDSDCDTVRSTPLPFWGYYPTPHQYSKQSKDNIDTDSESDHPRSTPLPNWGYYPPPPQYSRQSKDYTTDTDSESDHPRNTPLPFWGCYSPFYPIPYSETDSDVERSKSNRTTPASDQEYMYNPGWTPYPYYPYMYGYPPPPHPPPMYPYPFYPPMHCDTEEIAGYSSTDEMAYYNSKFVREKNSPTPTPQIKTPVESDAYEEGSSSSDDETETEVEDEESLKAQNSSLQAIRSVSDINVYYVEDEDMSDATTTDENEDASVCTEEDIIPHQLSVIYEESERSETSRMARESSVATTASGETVAMGNDQEEDEFVTCDHKYSSYSNTSSMNSFDPNKDIDVKETNSYTRLSSDTSSTTDSFGVRVLANKSGVEIEETKSIQSVRNSVEHVKHTTYSRESDDIPSTDSIDMRVPPNKSAVDIEEIKSAKSASDSVENLIYSLNQQGSDDFSHDVQVLVNKSTEETMSVKIARVSEENLKYSSYSHVLDNTESTITTSPDSLYVRVLANKGVVDVEEITLGNCVENLKYSRVSNDTSSTTMSPDVRFHLNKDAESISVKSTISNEENLKYSYTSTMPDSFDAGLQGNKVEETKSVKSSYSHVSSGTSSSTASPVSFDFRIKANKVKETCSSEDNLKYFTPSHVSNDSSSTIAASPVSFDVRINANKVDETEATDSSEENLNNCSNSNLFKDAGSFDVIGLNANKVEETKSINLTDSTESNLKYSTYSHISNDTSSEIDSFDIRRLSCKCDPDAQETKSVKSAASSDEQDWWSVLGNNEDDISRTTKTEDRETETNVTDDIHSETSGGGEEEEEEEEEEEDENDIDFWKIIESDEPQRNAVDDVTEQVTADIVSSVEMNDETSSTSSSDSSSVCSDTPETAEPDLEKNEENDRNEVKMLTIKERIKALQEASKNKFNSSSPIQAKEEKSKTIEELQESTFKALKDASGNVTNTKPKEETQTKSFSTKSSVKSFEDMSEDEMDSGVTSDVSRHISDNESDFPELRKMTRYQRAATHSRLFKLLQDECEQEDEDEQEKFEETVIAPPAAAQTRKNTISKEQLEKEKLEEDILIRRESLSLPLNKNFSESDSFSSSGINSPGSPVINERLVNELVHSLLRRKKGQIFRNMSMEKLHSAAFRILQEELESPDASYDEFLSPIKSCSSPTNYSEYAQYYDSWSEAERLYQASYDILPSKAFKLIQEQAVMNRTGSISGFLARCPRVLSAKNIHKELLSVLESRESPVPNPDVETKGAASAS